MEPILIAPLLILLFVLLATAVFQWLWNITMPEVFGLREIRFWVAFRLLLIAGFLVSPFITFSLGLGLR